MNNNASTEEVQVIDLRGSTASICHFNSILKLDSCKRSKELSWKTVYNKMCDANLFLGRGKGNGRGRRGRSLQSYSS